MPKLEKLLSPEHFSCLSFCQHTIYSGRLIPVITIWYWSYCQSWSASDDEAGSVSKAVWEKKIKWNGICCIKINPYSNPWWLLMIYGTLCFSLFWTLAGSHILRVFQHNVALYHFEFQEIQNKPHLISFSQSFLQQSHQWHAIYDESHTASRLGFYGPTLQTGPSQESELRGICAVY